jgi:hypothetical protein
MNGYMHFARNNNNMCNIASYASYPTIAVNSSQATTRVTTTTTTRSTTTTTTKPINNLCPNGFGFYANHGCKTFYYCSGSLSNFYCASGYLFDSTTQSCKPSNQVNCKVSNKICSNGSGFYPYNGCQSIYYCNQQITNFSVPSGFLFDPNSNSYKPANSFTCPV